MNYKKPEMLTGSLTYTSKNGSDYNYSIFIDVQTTVNSLKKDLERLFDQDLDVAQRGFICDRFVDRMEFVIEESIRLYLMKTIVGIQR